LGDDLLARVQGGGCLQVDLGRRAPWIVVADSAAARLRASAAGETALGRRIDRTVEPLSLGEVARHRGLAVSDPRDADGPVLGQARGRLADSIGILTDAWKRNRDDVEVAHELASVLAATGRKEEAEKVVNSLISWRANDPKAFRPDYTRALLADWDFDPRLKPEYGFPLYYGWLGAISDAFQKVHRGLAIGCPVLSMHSDEADVVLNWRHIARWSRTLGRDVTVLSFPGGWHDLVLSPPRIREEVFTQLFAWAERAVALPA
jgi:hypothetical protein